MPKVQLSPELVPWSLPTKARWRLIIPVAIEREIPRQIAGYLDVVCRIHVELYAAWLIECGKECSGEIKVRFVELEQPYVAGNQPRNKILGLGRDISFAVLRVLPCKSPQHGDRRPVRIFQVPSDTGTDRGLKFGYPVPSFAGSLLILHRTSYSKVEDVSRSALSRFASPPCSAAF